MWRARNSAALCPGSNTHFITGGVCFTPVLSLHSKNYPMTSRFEGAASAALYLDTIPNYFSDLVGLQYRGPAINKAG